MIQLNQVINRIPSHWVALTDQVLVSGVNFVIGVILARAFGVTVFGTYIIAMTFLYYANTFQSSMVISPMMTAIPHETDETKRQELISGFLGYALILSLICVAGITLVTYILGVMISSLRLDANAAPLMFAIFGFQLQDWLRRALYAQHKTSWVLLLDLLAYGGQLVSLGILYFQQAITPATALISMAGIFFLSALMIIITQNIIPSLKQTQHVVKIHWRGSRDFFVIWQLQWAGSQGLSLFGGAVLGPQIVGAFRASTNLVAPVNVIFQWLDNVIPVRTVLHLNNGGLPEMYKFLTRMAWVGCLFFGVMVVGLYFSAESLLGLLYGDTYRPYAFFVILQAIYLWLGHFYRLEFYGCRATNKTAEIVRASLIMALVAIGTGVLGVYWVGGSAIILALILGQSVSHLYLIYRRKFA